MDIKPPPRSAGEPKVAPEPEPVPVPIKKFDTPQASPPPKTVKQAKPKRHLLPWFKKINLSKKQWAIVIAVIIVLVVAGAYGAYKLYKAITKVQPQAAQVKPPPKTTEPSRLTGIEIDSELNKRPVTAVMIENSPDARPQSGLYNAGVVFEAIAEGGITRFMALYLEDQPKYIGPVRSVRPYYLDFALPFQAALAHVGGSPKALQQIRSLKVRDLDQFANADAYQRVDSRYAPHNVYTSIESLDKVQKRKGFTKSDFTSWPRLLKAKPAKTVTAKTISFDISSYYYNVSFAYDNKSNSYLRSQGSARHNDERAKKQIAPKVVIALVMAYGIDSDGVHSKYTTTGSGSVFIFQNGEVTKGTWTKKERSSQLSFKDSEGKVIKLNPGQTWVTLLAATNQVSYKP